MKETASKYLALGVIKTLDVPCPLFIERGQGAYVHDVDGNRYIDMIMGFGTHILGHRPPDVEAAVREQLEEGWHFGLNNNHQGVLAEKIVDASGDENQVLFCGSGSEAVMYACRAARGYTGRERIAVFDGSYHGSVDYALVKGKPGNRNSEFVSYTLGAGVPACISSETMCVFPYNDEASFDLIRRDDYGLAAVLVQPVQNGVPRLDQPWFLQGLREACDEVGAMLIYDEVVTGARLAYGGARERFGVRPDLTAYGKSIGGGLPVGAVAGPRQVMELFPRANDKGGVFSSGTFNANPLTMVAGIAIMTDLGENRNAVYPQLQREGDRLAGAVNAFAEDRELPVVMMNADSILCLHFEREMPRSARDLRHEFPDANRAFFLGMLDRGVLMPSGRMSLLSYAHDTVIIDEVIAAIRATLGEMRADGVI